VNIIVIRVKINKEQTTRATIYIYKVYNLFFKDYKTIYNKKSLLIIATTLHISSESILIEDFNLYYAI